MTHAEDEEPAVSIIAEARLVAYAWPTTDGQLRRATGKQRESLLPLGYADVDCLAPALEAQLLAIAKAAADWDAFLFKLQLEGWSLVPGRFQPNARLRRF